MSDRPVTVREACEMLGGRSDKFVLSLIKSGKIRATKIGKLWFINRQSVLDLLPSYDEAA